MGQKDQLTRQYMSDDQIFADAFNFFIYGGRPVIRPEQLHPLDAAVSQTVYRQQEHHTLFKLRDELKYVSLMADASTAYAILGIENQSSIHQAMPVRSLLYDALQYTSQVQHIAAAHQRKQEHGQGGGEFLSGFHRQDRLIPVVTLVIYFGADHWDGPKSLHEMMDFADEALKAQVEDYRIHLITPEQLTGDDFALFRTSLGPVLQFIKQSKDKSQLQQLVQQDCYRKLDRMAALVINSCTNANLQFDETEEEIDMCKAIDDMRMESRNEGIDIGLERGRKETAVNLLRSGKLTLEEIAECAKLSLAEVTAIANTLPA